MWLLHLVPLNSKRNSELPPQLARILANTHSPCVTQLAVDTTLVGALHADGTPRRNAALEDGVALKAAKRKKVRAYPELVGPNSRAQLVFLAVEVGGRWPSETRAFLSQLAKARAREEVPLMRRRVEQAWRLRWGAMLGCEAA